MSSPYEVHVLHDGYSKMVKGTMYANCTCTLITGPKKIIVDTMTAWDKDKILASKIFFIFYVILFSI